MGCGTSINENEVKSPSRCRQPVEQASPDSKNVQEIKQDKLQVPVQVNVQQVQVQEKTSNKYIDLKEIKTEKSINQGQELLGTTKDIASKQQQIPAIKIPNTRILLFGQSKQQRKILQFQTHPTPHIETLLSRTHNLPPVKYQPQQIILQQSQQLTSSHLYISKSHPPYNYMLAIYIRPNTIFLCGGVNYGFDYVSNQAFLFYVKDQTGLSTPHKPDQQGGGGGGIFKKQRRIGNNLMGAKFQKLPLMRVKRYSHMGVFYRVGKLGFVYVIGGRTENDEAITKCEKYSIEENKWTEIAQLNAPRSTGFSIIINKKIYVFGGYTKQGKRSKKIQRYNPSFDNWEVLNIKLHKGIETGLILPCQTSNQILIVGGNVEYGSIKSVIRVNFESETYCWDSDMKKDRLLQKGLSILQQNIAYILGGDFQDTTQKYSYKQKTWKIVPNLSYSQCISPQDINAFSFGQQTIQLIYDQQSLGNNKSTIKDQQDNTVSGGYRYVFGTDDYPCIYEINTNKWVLKKKNVPMVLRLRCFMTVVKIKEGKIFVCGGVDSFFQKASRASYIYYPGTNKAIQTAKMKQKKYAFAACAYNNYVYIFGGQDGKQGKILAEAQKYNITQDKWQQLPQLPQERTFSKAILTPTNKILIIGGTDSVYQNISQSSFDPETETYSTYEDHFPLLLDIKFLEFTGKTVSCDVKKQADEFQYLNQYQSDLQLNSAVKNGEDNLEENLSNPVPMENVQKKCTQKISQHCLLVFGNNSFKKQDQANQLSVSLGTRHHISNPEKPCKLFPFSLCFSQSNPTPVYYLISNKGVFRWDEAKKQVESQIVINQMHMLQMPLEKFCLA